MNTYFTFCAPIARIPAPTGADNINFDSLYNMGLSAPTASSAVTETTLRFHTVYTDLDRIKQTRFITNQKARLQAFLTKYTQLINAWKEADPDDCLENHYRSFPLPKRHGGMRPIDAPDAWLMDLLRQMKNDLQDSIIVLPHNAAHAYVRHRSNLTAIKVHVDNKSYFKVHFDFHNFFGSITHSWACEMLKMVYPFSSLNAQDWETFKEILKMAFLGDKLPQGTPLSPYLTNIIMVPFEYELTKRLIEWAKRENTVFVYTQFADDMIISSRKSFLKEQARDQVLYVMRQFRAPFSLNEDKTKYGTIAGRNFELGLMWNAEQKITLGHKKVRELKQQLLNFCIRKSEVITNIDDAQTLLGNLAYFKYVETEYALHVFNTYAEKYNKGIPILDELADIIKKFSRGMSRQEIFGIVTA